MNILYLSARVRAVSVIVLMAASLFPVSCTRAPRTQQTPLPQAAPAAGQNAGGAQQAAPAAEQDNHRAPQTAGQSEENYAKASWWELPTRVSASSEAWVMPYCEADAAAPANAAVLPTTSPAAASYNAPVTGTLARSPVTDAALAEVGQAFKQRGMAAPAADLRLSRVAEELASIARKDQRMPASLVDMLAHRQGIVEPVPETVILWGPSFDPAALAAQVRAELPAMKAMGDYNRVGVGFRERQDLGTGVGMLVLVFQMSHIELAPVPRELPAGSTATFAIKGRLGGGFTNAQLVAYRDNGDRLAPALQGDAETFHTQLSCGAYQGRLLISIGAKRGSETTVLANFPIFCGVAAPTSITYQPLPASTGGSTKTLAAEMAASINRERRRCGLWDIPQDQTLTAVARAHSQAMAEKGRIFHQAEGRIAPARERVQKAGLHTSVVHEFVARSYSLDEIKAELLNRFDFRAAMLSESTTHMGVGIVLQKSGNDTQVFVTEIFVSVPAAVTEKGVAAAVKRRIDRMRRLVIDSQLAQSAAQAAQALRDGVAANTVVDRTIRELKQVNRTFGGVNILIWKIADVRDFQPDAALFHQNVTHGGIAVMRGRDSSDKAGDFHVVVIIAERK